MTAAIVQPGEIVLGKYEIKGTIGVGGMGQVFRAKHLRTERAVAVKLLPANGSEEHALRFEREAALMTRVRHPNVVEILDFGFVHKKLPCIVMELVEGESLSARLERNRALPWPEAVRMILGVLDGLEAVHEAQIIHRDLKPSNIAIAHGKPEVVKLLDFGIARSLNNSDADRRVTRTGNIVGSLDYMSPEALVNDPIDVRTDVYSAGMMFFEMLSGGFPFRDDAMAAAFRRLSTDPPAPVAPAPNEPIPQPIVDLVLRALSRDRDERPASAEEFAHVLRDELQKIKRTLDRHTRPHEPPPPAEPPTDLTALSFAPTDRPPRPERRPTPQPAPAVVPPPRDTPREAIAPSAPKAPPPKRVLKDIVVSAPKPPPVAPTAPAVVQPSSGRSSSDSVAVKPAPGRVERPQFVVVARLPEGKLALVEERRWLAELVRNAGKAYALSAELWCAVLYALEPAGAEKQSLVLLDALESRYPRVKVVGGTIFDPRFELKGGAQPGASSLPDPLPSLIGMLATMGR